MEWVKYFAKAIVGAGIAFCGSLATAYADGHVTPIEWLTVGLTTLTALGSIIGISNGSKPDEMK